MDIFAIARVVGYGLGVMGAFASAALIYLSIKALVGWLLKKTTKPIRTNYGRGIK